MEEMIAEFKHLLDITLRLMGPDGCPWDREQTIASMRGSLLEEAYEMQEAIDESDDPHLVEELGDVLYNVLFFCALGEKEQRFLGRDVVRGICEKLITRHPHVFGEQKLQDSQSVKEQWEKIKHEKRESLMDGIPKALPALTKAMKMAEKMKRAGFPKKEDHSSNELGQELWNLVLRAREKGLHPEHELREYLFSLEKEFREWERGSKKE